MREAVGSTFLFKLMIIFIFFFASFLAIAINYSQAFRVKNQVINLIEQYEGLDDVNENRIFNLLNSSGYHRIANCDCTTADCNSRNADANGAVVRNNSGTPANGLCIRRLKTGNSGEDVYYRVTTFVSFNLPIVGNFFTFPVRGETKVITNDTSA